MSGRSWRGVSVQPCEPRTPRRGAKSKLLSTQVLATLIFDEAQQLKNATTQRAKAAAALQAEAWFPLSGTPLENHLGELWSLHALVFPSRLGSWREHRGRPPWVRPAWHRRDLCNRCKDWCLKAS
jgi:hypothetical protein